MRKLVGVLVLAVGLAAVAFEQQNVGAQAKADPKKVDDKTKKAAPSGTVEIYEGKDGFRFRIKNAEGKTVAGPFKGYKTKEEVVSVLEFIKNTLNNSKPTEVKD